MAGSLLAGLAAIATANNLSIQIIGATVSLFSSTGLAAAIFAMRVPPKQVTVQVPTKISIQDYLTGLERLLAGDSQSTVTAPEQLTKAERQKLDAATADIRRLLVDQQDLSKQVQQLEQAEHIPMPQAEVPPLATGHLSGPADLQLAQLSAELEKLAAQLLSATGSNEENRDSTQEQLASLKLQARKLADRSRALADTVDLLKDLAEQSGVLALNAAIQASRSGESGLGVVADELQRVANRHADASRQLEESLLQMNNEIGETNDMIDSGRKHLSQGHHDISQLRRHIATLARTCSELQQDDAGTIDSRLNGDLS